MAITFGGLASTMVQTQMAGVSLKQDSGGMSPLMSMNDMKIEVTGYASQMNLMSQGQKKSGLVSGLLGGSGKKPGLPGINQSTLIGLAGAAVGQMADKAGLSLGKGLMGGNQKGLFSFMV